MRKLPVIWLLMLLLGAVVPGCGGAHRYDSRLTAVDSLMRNHPDSALKLLEALPPDSLVTEHDRAYRDLLLTQARYKAYITATSDSDINRALDYYCAHPSDQEKLTRAYIYKGAVMNELGFPDSALIYYKIAEDKASNADYYNLGYIKLQMGALYNDFYSMEGPETVKYEEALECFRKTNDSVYILLCLNNLGCLYRDSKPKKAELTLLGASRMARQLHDTTSIAYNDLSLAVLYFHQERYEQARRLIWEMRSFDNHRLNYKMHFTAAKVYARLGILDTAQMYLDLAQKCREGDEALYRMHHLRGLSEMSLARKDTVTSIRLSHESYRIEDSLTSNARKLEILQSEVKHDKESMEKSQRKHKSRENSYKWLISLLVFVSTSVLFWVYRRARRNAHRYDGIISDLKDEINNQSVNLSALNENINSLKIKDDDLRVFINSHNNMMREVIEECYHLPHGPLAKAIRKIVKYQDENYNIWSKLYSYLDIEFNNIMSETQRNYPQLDEKDLLIIALTCMGYSCAQIAIVFGYSSSSGISTIRKRIAKKMGLNCLLADYIGQFKSSL